MDNLNKDDLKVLIRIDRKMLDSKADKISQFPELDEKQISLSIDKLKMLGLIILDKDTWTLTHDGQNMLDKNQDTLSELYSDFMLKEERL